MRNESRQKRGCGPKARTPIQESQSSQVHSYLAPPQKEKRNARPYARGNNVPPVDKQSGHPRFFLDSRAAALKAFGTEPPRRSAYPWCGQPCLAYWASPRRADWQLSRSVSFILKWVRGASRRRQLPWPGARSAVPARNRRRSSPLPFAQSRRDIRLPPRRLP